MSGDQILRTVLRACDVLADPNVTQKRVASMAQVCSVLKDSVLAQLTATLGVPYGSNYDSDKEADPDLQTIYDLAAATTIYIKSLEWPDDTDWWIEYRGRMKTAWHEARRAAEIHHFGAASEATLVAGAESGAEIRTDDGAREDTMESLIPPDAGPTVLFI
jgi:hypothetical protein